MHNLVPTRGTTTFPHGSSNVVVPLVGKEVRGTSIQGALGFNDRRSLIFVVLVNLLQQFAQGLDLLFRLIV